MLANSSLLIVLARQRMIDLQAAGQSSRVGRVRVGSSAYRLPDGAWIRARREAS